MFVLCSMPDSSLLTKRKVVPKRETWCDLRRSVQRAKVQIGLCACEAAHGAYRGLSGDVRYVPGLEVKGSPWRRRSHETSRAKRALTTGAECESIARLHRRHGRAHMSRQVSRNVVTDNIPTAM